MTEGQVLELLFAALGEIKPGLPRRAMQAGSSMVDLGVNSMERAEVIMAVLDQMNLDIALIETFGPRSLGELSLLLASKQHAT